MDFFFYELELRGFWYRKIYPYCHTSHTRLFWGGIILEKRRGMCVAQDGMEDGFFFRQYQGVLRWIFWEFHAHGTCISRNNNSRTTPRVWPWYFYPPPPAQISSQRRVFNRWKCSAMSPTTSSAGDIVRRASPTKNRCHRLLSTTPRNFCKTKSEHNNQMDGGGRRR